MDWKQEAADKLLQYEARRQAVGNIQEEIMRLELDYSGLRAAALDADKVQKSKDNGREDMMLTNIVRRNELKKQLESCRAWVALVDRALQTLDKDDTIVLDAFYIHRHKNACELVCEKLDREKAQVYRRRDRALRRFTIALYGGMES